MGSSRNLESDYQRALLARLSAEHRNVRFFRRNVGLVRMADDRLFRAGVPGQCDLYAVGRGGWHGEIEVKRYTSLSPEQMMWRDWCADWQVPWLMVQARKAESPGATVERWGKEIRKWLVEKSAPL